MYQIKATLCNQARPELGKVTVEFPIFWKEYEDIISKLDALQIGDPTARDCQIETLDSRCRILKRLETSQVNLDELDNLAKRLNDFCVDEYAQYQAAAIVGRISDIEGFINLTFCYQLVTLVRDFRNLEQAGQDHLIALNDGYITMGELRNSDLRRIALDLLENGSGTVTPYGVAYKNGMELVPHYTGGPFPNYCCNEPLMVEFQPPWEDGKDHYLFLPMAESRLFRELTRNGVTQPDALNILRIGFAPTKSLKDLPVDKENIFTLNRLAMALDALPPIEITKMDLEMDFADLVNSQGIDALIERLEQKILLQKGGRQGIQIRGNSSGPRPKIEGGMTLE